MNPADCNDSTDITCQFAALAPGTLMRGAVGKTTGPPRPAHADVHGIDFAHVRLRKVPPLSDFTTTFLDEPPSSALVATQNEATRRLHA